MRKQSPRIQTIFIQREKKITTAALSGSSSFNVLLSVIIRDIHNTSTGRFHIKQSPTRVPRVPASAIVGI